MRVFASCVALAMLLAAGGVLAPARAMDTIPAATAPDLTSVRAKIKAKDFKGALAELTPMLATHQDADVYNLMGFSLRKRARISGRALCRDRPDRQGEGERRALEDALPERLRGA